MVLFLNNHIQYVTSDVTHNYRIGALLYNKRVSTLQRMNTPEETDRQVLNNRLRINPSHQEYTDRDMDYKVIFQYGFKQITIRWIRTGSQRQPHRKIMFSLVFKTIFHIYF